MVVICLCYGCDMAAVWMWHGGKEVNWKLHAYMYIYLYIHEHIHMHKSRANNIETAGLVYNISLICFIVIL